MYRIEDFGNNSLRKLPPLTLKRLFLSGEWKFDQLSKSGENEWSVALGECNTENEETIYVASLPTYKNGFLKDDIIEEMKEDGYYDDWYYEGSDEGNRGRCFFRVTKDEYDDVTSPFFDAGRQAGKEGKKFSFTPNLD